MRASTAAAAMAGASACAGPGAGRATAADPGATDPRFASLAGYCDGVTPVSEDERAAHRDRARRLATERGYAALVMEAGVNLHHLTGVRWRPSERPLLYVLPSDGDPFFIGPSFEEGTLREAFTGAPALFTWREHESPYALAVRVLGERGVRAGRIGCDPAMRWFVVDGLTRADARLSFQSGADAYEALRMHKSEAELSRLERANQATKAALAAVAGQIEVGMDEDQVTALVRAAQESAGLTNVWALVAFGEHAAFPHGTRARRPLAEGDLILCDTGGDLYGYHSDITRTWPMGEPSAQAREAWDTVLAAQAAAMEWIRPGVTCGQVDAVAREHMAAAGHGSDYERFTHRLGHGIGREGHEPPYLVRDSERVLEPGMTMSNEPGIYIPGVLGVRIEDIVAVTDTGHEVFGPLPRSLDDPFGLSSQADKM